MSRPLRALINTQSLQHNFQRVRQFAPKSKIMAVVKADAYGHGLVQVAEALPAADAFAVASIDEAIRLQDALHSETPICLLEGLFSPDELGEVTRRSFQVVIHSAEQLEFLERSGIEEPVKVWLKIDTGMNRLGIAPEEFVSSAERLRNIPNVQLLGVMSHLACADDSGSSMTPDQLQSFEQTVANTGIERCLANSSGIVQWPQTHFDWVRPGIMLYGSSPVSGKSAHELDLKPVMSLVSEIVSIRPVKKGSSVGYGCSWRAEQDTVIGVVACGYGDGYPRHAVSGTPVLVDQHRVPLVGRVSMDMITVDLGSAPDVSVGSEVTLFGEGISIDEIARCASTISYEILCQITTRVPRIYL
jgi:alanine racemase